MYTRKNTKIFIFLLFVAILLILVLNYFFISFFHGYKYLIQTDLNTKNEEYRENESSQKNIYEDYSKNYPDLKIILTGDMMFDRGVRSNINRNGFNHITGPLEDIFKDYDLVIGNLEGTITTYPSKLVMADNTAIPGFQFTFSTSTARHLKNIGFDILSLSNNHTSDFGPDGLKQTREYLEQSDMLHLGSFNNQGQISTTTCIHEEMCLGLVVWHEFGSQNDIDIKQEILNLKQEAHFIIVYPHWGEEYKSGPNEKQISLAKSWIDAGADAIVGHHPHVVQRIERYKQKPIFYSLGNTLFDQYFSFNTTHGVLLEIMFEYDIGTKLYKHKYKLIPLSSVSSMINKTNASTTERLFDYIFGISEPDLKDWISLHHW
jgi:poly-gamma-glutamate capsule biosynthesis protein CapA/YwtB (metallophosphatase superfamily)